MNPSSAVAGPTPLTPGGTAYAAGTVGGVVRLYTLNLGTGAVTPIGTIGAGNTPLAGLAFGP